MKINLENENTGVEGREGLLGRRDEGSCRN